MRDAVSFVCNRNERSGAAIHLQRLGASFAEMIVSLHMALLSQQNHFLSQY
jgi:hypothetical protein